MPRRNPGRTSTMADAVRANVLAWLEANERSIPWLAGKMSDLGCPISSGTAWKMLKSDRDIFVNEAVAMSSVTGISLTELLPQGAAVRWRRRAR